MTGRVLLLGLLASHTAAGCGIVQRQPLGTVVDVQSETGPRAPTRESGKRAKAAEGTQTAESREKGALVVEAFESSPDRHGWLARARRRFSEVGRDIKADLDFHDNEGLEQFAPDAVEQVRTLRGEMNGPSDITR